MTPQVVFIHLGSGIPRYLEKNIVRTRHLFPDIKIIVAGQTSALRAVADGVKADYFPVPNAFGDPELAASGLARKGLDTKFWGGYWQKTFDRLLVFALVHQHNDGPLIHIESDVIITRDFPFDILGKSSQLMWGAYDSFSDIASVVFSPEKEESRWLAAALAKVARLDETATDMTALAVVRRQHPKRIQLLAATPELASLSGQPGVIFDGLHIGEWVFGWDPKAHWGFKRRRLRINPHSEIVAESSLQLTGQSLYLTANGIEARVASLHVHSKELKFFENDISEDLSRLLKVVGKPRLFYGFAPAGFVSWLISRLGRWSATLLRNVVMAFRKDVH